MFTYDSISTMTEFTMMRPILISIFVMMMLVFFTVTISKFRTMYNNVLPILLMSVIGVIVSAQILFYKGILVDELGLSGDAVSTILFLFIGVIALVNPILYLWKKIA